MSKIKDAKLNIKERHLGKHKALGLYWESTNSIEIDPRLTAKEYLYVLTHELTHMSMPEATEDTVIKISKIISKGIWQQGFRRVKE